jgi:protein-tyrosine phosphatase
MKFTDISCHFLDGTDCGPDSFAESLALCRKAASEGLGTIVLTPRWKAGCSEPPLPVVDCVEKIDRLQGALGRTLDLKLGFALQFSDELPALVDRYGSLLALNGKRHLLVSLPASQVPSQAESIWFALGERGFSVILAQPECSPVLRQDPQRIAAWVQHDIKLQINAGSVVGKYGREIRRFALDCLRAYDQSAFVATNSHTRNGGMPSLKKAHEELSNAVGARRARKFVSHAPASIISDSATSNGKERKTSARRPSFFLRALRSYNAS